MLTVPAAAVARRGAGGAFVKWRITAPGENNDAHCLGAYLVGASLSLELGAPEWFGLFALGWLLLTKPTPHLCFRTIDHPSAIMRAFWYAAACARMALILPLAYGVYYLAHGLHLTPAANWFCMLAILPLPYYAGGVLQHAGKIRDAVEFGEWGYFLCGLMLWGLAQ